MKRPRLDPVTLRWLARREAKELSHAEKTCDRVRQTTRNENYSPLAMWQAYAEAARRRIRSLNNLATREERVER